MYGNYKLTNARKRRLRPNDLLTIIDHGFDKRNRITIPRAIPTPKFKPYPVDIPHGWGIVTSDYVQRDLTEEKSDSQFQYPPPSPMIPPEIFRCISSPPTLTEPTTPISIEMQPTNTELTEVLRDIGNRTYFHDNFDNPSNVTESTYQLAEPESPTPEFFYGYNENHASRFSSEGIPLLEPSKVRQAVATVRIAASKNGSRTFQSPWLSRESLVVTEDELSKRKKPSKLSVIEMFQICQKKHDTCDSTSTISELF